MQIEITSKTEKGVKALTKLMGEFSWGVAKRKVISLEPYAISVEPVGIRKFGKFLKGNPYVVDAVAGPMKKVLYEYGATDEDFSIEVVF